MTGGEAMKKEITIEEFSRELVERIEKAKAIDCCREEIKELARIAAREIPKQKIVVEWKESSRD